jgi:peptide/nickel transport system ATP-binding protein
MTTPPTPADALHVEGLRVSFRTPGGARTEVLHGIDLRIAPGECVAVVGPSGAGKSVLSRALLGLGGDGVSSDRFELGGRDTRRWGPRAWRAARGGDVALVLQDALASLDPLRTIEAEVGEALAVRRTPRRARRERVIAALRAAGLSDAESFLRRRSGQLSGGMRQRALIASALVGDPPLLVADEPTTALDAATAAGVLALLGRLRDEGRAILLVSHDLGAVARVADRVIVLSDGRIVESGRTSDVLNSPTHPVARALRDAVPRGPKPPPAPHIGKTLVRGTGLRRRYRVPGAEVTALDGVDVHVRAGETLGIVGPSGSGKSTLARLLVGAERPDDGAVERSGTRVRLVPQDPLSSFDPRLQVRSILRHAGATQASEAQALLSRVGLSADILRRRPATLSGGQRQRVAIARALAGRPDVLVCDEPVSALDVTTQAGILELLRSLQRDGVGIVFVSHDLGVVRQVSDRVMVVARGVVREEGATEELFAAPRDPLTRELIAAATLPI